MSRAVRLRPLVEVVRDDDHLWLLRGPAGGDCRIADPDDAVVELVRLLAAGGGSAKELARALATCGEAEVEAMLADLDAAELLEPVAPEPADDRLSRQLLYLRDRRPRSADASEMQRAVRDARIAIIGCGGLGSWAAAGLACIGVGTLTLIDFDVVERSNLNRQLLFRERDIGRAKVAAAAASLRAFDGSLEVRAVERTIDGVAAARRSIAGHDFVVACADHPPYEIARWINAACLEERIPHISAGQLPPIVRVGPTVVPGATACLACLESALRAGNPLYDRLEALRRDDRRPQATLGPASGIVGQVIAMEILHHLSGLTPPATTGAVWSMDLRTLQTERTPVDRLDDCPACS